MSHRPWTDKDGSIFFLPFQFDMNIKVISKPLYYMYWVFISVLNYQGSPGWYIKSIFNLLVFFWPLYFQVHSPKYLFKKLYMGMVTILIKFFFVCVNVYIASAIKAFLVVSQNWRVSHWVVREIQRLQFFVM